jgi:hypothetical protein
MPSPASDSSGVGFSGAFTRQRSKMKIATPQKTAASNTAPDQARVPYRRTPAAIPAESAATAVVSSTAVPITERYSFSVGTSCRMVLSAPEANSESRCTGPVRRRRRFRRTCGNARGLTGS